MSDASRNVAVLGTGTMGAPIARNLIRAGYRVRVWNRTTPKAAVVAAEGAHLASSPAAATDGADVVITMLSDGAAVEEVMTGPAGALSTLSSEAVWIQMSTVGVESCTRRVDLAGRNGLVLVDAPVSGSTAPAAAGELVVLAAGARPVRSKVEPIFEVLGRRTLWLERAGDGSRLKLALNNWLAVLVEGMAETLTLSEALGIDPQRFLDAVTGGPMASDYAMSKGSAMLGADFTAAGRRRGQVSLLHAATAMRNHRHLRVVRARLRSLLSTAGEAAVESDRVQSGQLLGGQLQIGRGHRIADGRGARRPRNRDCAS